MQTKADLETQAKKNHKAHRAAEAATLALLLRARTDAVSAGNGNVAATAVALRPRLRDAIVLGRQGAGERGIERLVKEGASVGASFRASSLDPVDGFYVDWQRAVRASRSYSDAWLRKAVELDDVKAATAVTRGSVERIAVTESSEAFTSARTRVARTDSSAELMRVWDASLDRRTCEVCEGANGTIVGVRESFPAGEPGSVHSFCRCGWTLTTVSFATKAKL
jgi:hypothetical protein